MNEVATHSKGIEGIILARRVVGLEIKHHIQVAHLGYLGITRDDATYLIGKDGITIIAFPFLQVVAEGYTNALSLQIVIWIDAASIVEHHKTILRQFFGQTTPLALRRGAGGEAINGTLVLHQLLPPLHVFVINAHQRFFA